MSEAGAPAEGDLMSRLRENGVTQLRLICHDCSGRPQVKSAPSDRFAEVIARGVNFAKANLDYNVLDEQVPGRCFRRPHRRLPRGFKSSDIRHASTPPEAEGVPLHGLSRAQRGRQCRM